ncbi:hypothetical protein [Hymenobacter terrenus]|uniref:hypothetical protein n=1 Tax=Hymenobacter terrenus TaxID=1629124 RepID=UPI0006195F11|nr:hypothetical protein [Hymenobacter terrenus]
MDKTNINALLITGLFALLGTVAGGIVKGYWDDDLAQRKFYSDMVLKALESPDANARLQTLRMLTQTRLLDNEKIMHGVEEYIKTNATTPLNIPQVVPDAAAATLEAPFSPNARIYLLTGNVKKVDSLAALRVPLEKAGFPIIDARYLTDAGRPAAAEIRYFFVADRRQAEHLAEFCRIRLDQKDLAAKLYRDTRVSPGYLEIWTGR